MSQWIHQLLNRFQEMCTRIPSNDVLMATCEQKEVGGLAQQIRCKYL
jgi:hypothetical protein